MRIVTIEGVITAESVDRACLELAGFLSQSQDTITLVIDSPGGDTDHAHRLSRIIMGLGVPVNALVKRLAISAGFIILQSCTYRLANGSAKFMFHPPGFTAEEASQVFLFPVMGMDDVRDYNDEMYLEWLKRLSSRSNRSIDELEVFGRKELEFDAAQALKLGFIDKIV